MKQYKIKKGFGSSNNVELLVDQFTIAQKAETQFEIKDCFFTISQILRGEATNIRFINLKAKVTSIEDTRIVGSYPENKAKRQITLADETGHMNLVLWRERAENINFIEGDVLALQNMVVSNFNNHVSLTTSFDAGITKLEEQMSVSQPKAFPKSNVTSLETLILALKEFNCTFKCISCRMDINQNATCTSPMLKCPTCSTMFLKNTAQLNNQCMVLLPNNQWFTANTRVS